MKHPLDVVRVGAWNSLMWVRCCSNAYPWLLQLFTSLCPTSGSTGCHSCYQCRCCECPTLWCGYQVHRCRWHQEILGERTWPGIPGSGPNTAPQWDSWCYCPSDAEYTWSGGDVHPTAGICGESYPAHGYPCISTPYAVAAAASVIGQHGVALYLFDYTKWSITFYQCCPKVNSHTGHAGSTSPGKDRWYGIVLASDCTIPALLSAWDDCTNSSGWSFWAAGLRCSHNGTGTTDVLEYDGWCSKHFLAYPPFLHLFCHPLCHWVPFSGQQQPLLGPVILDAHATPVSQPQPSSSAVTHPHPNFRTNLWLWSAYNAIKAETSSTSSGQGSSSIFEWQNYRRRQVLGIVCTSPSRRLWDTARESLSLQMRIIWIWILGCLSDQEMSRKIALLGLISIPCILHCSTVPGWHREYHIPTTSWRLTSFSNLPQQESFSHCRVYWAEIIIILRLTGQPCISLRHCQQELLPAIWPRPQNILHTDLTAHRRAGYKSSHL